MVMCVASRFCLVDRGQHRVRPFEYAMRDAQVVAYTPELLTSRNANVPNAADGGTMTYERFEELILVMGGTVILGSIALSYAGGPPELAEVFAQVMLFGVLFSAVRYGRRGGLVAAIIASVLYLLTRMEMFSLADMTLPGLVVIASRLAGFGLVGVAGGEICNRVRYGMARLEGASALDDWSRVYNQRWAHRTLDAARARSQRYGEPFSVAVVSLSGSVLSGMRASRQRAIVRGVADHIRSDVRVVDEVSRLEDGRFVVLLPHTPRTGGQVVADRLARGATGLLGSNPDAISVRLMSLPGDDDAINRLIASIAPAADQDPSGEYSSSGANARKPAAETTSSAR